MLSNFAIFGLNPLWSIIVAILLLLIFIFEVWMLVSALTNESISSTAKILWVIGMVLVHPIVSIVYYFTDHKKRSPA